MATTITIAASQPLSFTLAAFVIFVGALAGPILDYSNAWRLIINISTMIVTFLMVFLVRKNQNRDVAAMHDKLDELLQSVVKASGQFIGIEHLTDQQAGAIRTALERYANRRSDKRNLAKETADRRLHEMREP